MYWTHHAKEHFAQFTAAIEAEVCLDAFRAAIQKTVTRKGRAGVQWMDVELYFNGQAYQPWNADPEAPTAQAQEVNA